MRVDVSEIKTFRNCKRQWMLSSRNKFHIRPKVTPTALSMGTKFHESLHRLYLGNSVDSVLAKLESEIVPDEIALIAMIKGYAEEVLPLDLEKYKVLDVEHYFEFPIAPDINVCGSIDMIVIDKETNQIFGFEHKTAKNYRDDNFLWMDEQPRVYTKALQEYIKKYNETHEPATLGGIYINEVKKLLRKFDYRRTLCVYKEADLNNFLKGFYTSCKDCHEAVNSSMYLYTPQPNFMGCKLCDFQTICQTYMYDDISEEQLLDEFQDEFEKRDKDHLDEKVLE